jgi:hypothetical protein
LVIEVKGMNKKDRGILSFDGRVVEVFGFGHRHPSKRFHIDQINLLINEDKALTIGYGEGMIMVAFTDGCENMDEFIQSINDASTNPDLVIK